MPAVGAFARVLRDDEVALWALLLRRFTRICVGFLAVEIDRVIQFPMCQDAGAEVDDDAVFLDDARVDFGIYSPQTPADHLHHGCFVGARARQDDAGYGLCIEAFGEDCYVDDNLYVAEL